MKNTFGFLPKKQSFEKAKNFILAHTSFTPKEYLRLFIKKYGEKINPKNFAELLVWMFELVDEDGE